MRKPPKGTTVPEFAAIVAAAKARNVDAHDLILFLGETGWRFSEGTALDVGHVEDDGTDVWVTVGQVFRIDGSGRQVLSLDEAKSYAGFRRIRLFPSSASVVRRRLPGKAPGDLVFTNSRGRCWNQNTFLCETGPRIVADAHLGDRKPTPHWLRHMHVAVLSAAGAPPQEIQRRIGHESIQTTINVYGGMIGDVSDTVVDNASAIMAGGVHHHPCQVTDDQQTCHAPQVGPKRSHQPRSPAGARRLRWAVHGCCLTGADYAVARRSARSAAAASASSGRDATTAMSV